MIKKRFHIMNRAMNLIKYGYCEPILMDEKTGKQYVFALDLMDLLNILHEENQTLKQTIKNIQKK